MVVVVIVISKHVVPIISMQVKAPWLKHFYVVKRHEEVKKGRACYIFPR